MSTRTPNPDKSITFTCSRQGCHETKTLYRSIYNKAKIHFCGMRCRDLAGHPKRGQKAREKSTISQQIKEYFDEKIY